MIQQNIRSIKCNLPGLLPIIARTAVEWDCIVLTECWLSSTVFLPSLDGYDSFATTNNLTQNEGVVVYYKNGLFISVEEPVIEDANCLVITLNKDTVALAIYRPPGHRNTDNFLQSLNQVLLKYSLMQNVILLGDININIAEHSTDSNLSAYLDMMAFHGMMPAYTSPTHNKTCLDHTFLKTKLTARCLILQTTITDHNSVALYIASLPKQKPAKTINYLDHNSLNLELNSVNFGPLYAVKNANEAADFLHSILYSAIKNNTKEVKISNKKIILKPWITPGILKCIRNRDNLYKKVKKHPDNETHKTTYKRYRNFCSSLLKKLKRDYEKLQFENAGKSSKKIWKIVKEITYSTKPKDSLTDLISTNDPQNSANNVNQYFANVGKTLAEKIMKNNLRTGPITNNSCSHSFCLLPTDEAEVRSLISGLRSDCSVGLDLISGDILKSNMDILTIPITYICNLSLTTGVFPKIYKKSRVHPIHKSGDRDCVNNYRPISILPTLSKILERIINKQLVNYLESKNLLSQAQFGFRAKRSTADAVSELTNYIVNNIDSKRKTIGIFLDLAKAFDTVSVPILLTKLESLGVRDLQLELLKDYLTDRTQCVKIGNITSEEVPVTFGVPQGSILGPTLFLVYINDICQLMLPDSKTVAFADDTALLFSGSSWHEVFVKAQLGMNTVISWLNKNLLTLNVEKTNFITFTIQSNDKPDPSLRIVCHSCPNANDTICQCPNLKNTESTKYLGVIIDRNLKFSDHLNLLTARVRRLMVIFKALRNTAPKSVLKSVYYALCQSQLEYCITTWGGTCKTHLLKVERAQRALLKVSLFLPFYHPTTDLYSKWEVLTVRQLFILRTVMKQHALTTFEPERFRNKRRKHAVCSSSSFKTKFARRFFCYQGSNLYNKLNRSLALYPLPKTKCKSLVSDWLKKLDYNFTESLLHSN